MDGAYSSHGRDEKYIQISFGNLERKRPLGRPMLRWKDNVRVDVNN
jgi:hypothetical protein